MAVAVFFLDISPDSNHFHLITPSIIYYLELVFLSLWEFDIAGFNCSLFICLLSGRGGVRMQKGRSASHVFYILELKERFWYPFYGVRPKRSTLATSLSLLSQLLCYFKISTPSIQATPTNRILIPLIPPCLLSLISPRQSKEKKVKQIVCIVRLFIAKKSRNT